MPDENGQPTAEERFAPKLPKQIQDQVDMVNEALATPIEGEEPDGQQPPEDGQEYDQPDDQGEDQGEYEQQPEPRQPLAPEESWEQRARSAQGRLDAMLASNQQMARRVSELENQLAGKKLKEPGPAEPATYAKPALIKEEELTDYGNEFFDVVGRRAKEVFSPELAQLADRLNRLEGKQNVVTEVIDRTQKRTVYEQLHEEVPMWREINHSPHFKQWIAQLDPYSGRPLAELLSDAMARHDGPRVVNFFRGFAEAAGLPLESPSPGPAAPPLANGNGSGRPSLEDYAAPGRARSAPQTLPPDKPVYTTAQIARLSDEKRRGLWRGREADLEAIERDIFAAQHEGRIQ